MQQSVIELHICSLLEKRGLVLGLLQFAMRKGLTGQRSQDGSAVRGVIAVLVQRLTGGLHHVGIW